MTTYSCVCYKYHYLQIRSPGALKQLSQSFLLLRHFAQHKVPTALSEREAINGFRWQRTSRTYEKFTEQFYASITSSYTVYGLTHRLNKLFWTKKVWITTSHKLSDLNCFLCISSAWWCDVTNSFCFIRVSIGAEKTFRNVHSGVVSQSGIIDFMFWCVEK